MSQRVKDGLMGAALLVVLGGGWYIWSLGALVMQHEQVVQALIRAGVVRVGSAPPPSSAPQAPTGEARP